MSAPIRVQQRRTKGWAAPENTVSVARPHRFGNPIRIVGKRVVLLGLDVFTGNQFTPDAEVRAFAVKSFRWQLLNHPMVIGYTVDDVRRELAGKNLMCFCPLDQPCHADVLLELANGAAS